VQEATLKPMAELELALKDLDELLCELATISVTPLLSDDRRQLAEKCQSAINRLLEHRSADRPRERRCGDCGGLLPDGHPGGFCPARDDPDYF
jgi:hypothetical protein